MSIEGGDNRVEKKEIGTSLNILLYIILIFEVRKYSTYLKIKLNKK